MDTNIFAIVANNMKTVKVRYQQIDRSTGAREFCSEKEYTYVTDEDLRAGDLVAVYVGSGSTAELKVAKVSTVDDGVDIQPNSDKEYKFVVSLLDTQGYEQVMKQKDEVERELARAYQQNVRRQFAGQILGNASPELMAKLGYSKES